MQHVARVLPLLLALVGVLVLGGLFAICRWGGTTLATHHNDPSEIGAAALVGVCALAMLTFVTHVELPGGPLAIALVGVAMAGGLFAGYGRAE
jgi:hypothetical protein